MKIKRLEEHPGYCDECRKVVNNGWIWMASKKPPEDKFCLFYGFNIDTGVKRPFLGQYSKEMGTYLIYCNCGYCYWQPEDIQWWRKLDILKFPD